MSNSQEPSIDFTSFPSSKGGSDEQDAWEQFAEDFLRAIGFEIASPWSRGADGGIDLKVIDTSGQIGPPGAHWLVSCKHFAHSGSTVGVSNERNIVDRILQHSASGFLGFYTTGVSSHLKKRLQDLEEKDALTGLGPRDEDFRFEIFQKNNIEHYLVSDLRLRDVFKRYLGGEYLDYFGISAPEVKLAPLLLVGAWNTDFFGDRELVEALFGKPADEYDRLLTNWAEKETFNIEKDGRIWRWKNHEQAWENFGPYVADLDWQKFSEFAVDILTEVHPKYREDDSRDFNFVPSRDDTDYSRDIRSGVVSTIWILSVFEDLDRGNREVQVASIVREVLRPDDWRVWATVDDELPIIAEAEPVVFCDALQASIGENTGVLSLFREAKSGNLSFPFSGLIRGLRVLAWSDDYLGRSVQLLAALAQKTPETNITPMPKDALELILNGIAPQCNASAETRLELLRTVERSAPDLAQALRLDLVPSRRMAMLSPVPVPQRPDWEGVEDIEAVDTEEQQEFFRGLMKQIVDFIDSNPRHLPDAVERVGEDSGPLATALAQWLRSSESEIVDKVYRTGSGGQIAQKLRENISRHNTYHSAENEFWSIIRAFYEKIEPDSISYRARCLFSHNINHPDGRLDDEDEERERAQTLRADLVGGILRDDEPVAVLKRAIRNAESANVAGRAVARYSPEVDVRSLLDSLDDGDRIRDFFGGYSDIIGSQQGADAVISLFEEIQPVSSEEVWGAVLQALPIRRETCDCLENYEPEIREAYWQSVPVIRRSSEEPEVIQHAVVKLQRAGRFAASLRFVRLSMPDDQGDENLNSVWRGVIVEALSGPMDDEEIELSVKELRNADYYVRDLLGILRGADTNLDQLGRLEWYYFPLVRRESDLVIYEALETDPEFFARLVEYAYDADRDAVEGEEPSNSLEGTEDWSEVQAVQAWRILHFDWEGFPGRTGGNEWDDAEVIRWVDEALELVTDANREETGRLEIGRALGRMPEGEDGIWPPRPVREFMEREVDQYLRRGLGIGRYNARGVHRGTGGREERKLSRQFSEWASELKHSYPQTSQCLRNLSNSFARDAAEAEERQLDTDEEEGGTSSSPFLQVEGVGKRTVRKLKQAGFQDFDDVRNSPEQLTDINGIGPKTKESLETFAKEQEEG